MFLFSGFWTVMANPFKNNFVVGITSGLVAAFLAPLLVPALKRSSRPITKGMIKGGMLLYEKGREMTAHAGELVEDVMAEIQAEQATKASGEEAWGHEENPHPHQEMREETAGAQPSHAVGRDGSVEPTRH